MKNINSFTYILAVIFGLSIAVSQNTEAGENRKTLPACSYCKRPVYSYYKFKTYENNQPVYAWEISGHSKCGSHATVVKVEKTAAKKEKASDEKAATETKAYAQHGEDRPYGGGSGYTAGYGSGNYVYGGERRRGGYVHGTAYGTNTVVRRTTVTRSTPARGIFGGFSGTSTRSYTTRTRTTRSGSFGAIWSGGNYGRSSICRY